MVKFTFSSSLHCFIPTNFFSLHFISGSSWGWSQDCGFTKFQGGGTQEALIYSTKVSMQSTDLYKDMH